MKKASDSSKTVIRRILADILGLAPARVTPKTSPRTVKNWDSLRHLSLVLALEKEFHLSFKPAEVRKLVGIDKIAATIAKKTR